jgi:hypothetical protein
LLENAIGGASSRTMLFAQQQSGDGKHIPWEMCWFSVWFGDASSCLHIVLMFQQLWLVAIGIAARAIAEPNGPFGARSGKADLRPTK